MPGMFPCILACIRSTTTNKAEHSQHVMYKMPTNKTVRKTLCVFSKVCRCLTFDPCHISLIVLWRANTGGCFFLLSRGALACALEVRYHCWKIVTFWRRYQSKLLQYWLEERFAMKMVSSFCLPDSGVRVATRFCRNGSPRGTLLSELPSWGCWIFWVFSVISRSRRDSVGGG